MKYRAVLFDLDGTLLDTIQDLADSMNCVLESLGFPSHGVESYKYFVGEGMDVLVRRALPESRRNDDAVFRNALAAMRDEYGRRSRENTRPYEGIPDLLNCLTERKMKMAILSNKPDEDTKLVVAELLPFWEFDTVAGARNSIPKKPDPTGAMEIARSLNIPTSEFLYLGDTSIDMRTAKASGMFAVGVLWGFRKADELISSGAQVLINKPIELLLLLE